MPGRELSNHLQDVGRAASTAVAGRGGGAGSDLIESPGALADHALDRPVFDVIAAADGLQTANCRVLLLGPIHVARLTHSICCSFPIECAGILIVSWR